MDYYLIGVDGRLWEWDSEGQNDELKLVKTSLVFNRNHQPILGYCLTADGKICDLHTLRIVEINYTIVDMVYGGSSHY